MTYGLFTTKGDAEIVKVHFVCRLDNKILDVERLEHLLFAFFFIFATFCENLTRIPEYTECVKHIDFTVMQCAAPFFLLR